MRLHEVDPFDDDTLAAWHATVVAADVHGRKDRATPWALEEVRAAYRAEQGDESKAPYVGIEDGAVVVAGGFQCPHLDNTDHAYVEVYTHPGHRRRGHGSAMLAHLEQVAREHGRSVIDTEATWPYDAPADGAGTPNADFLTRRGYSCGLGDVARALDLPVADALLDDLAAETAPHHAAYPLRSWVGEVPEDIVPSFAELISLLMVEAPLGELEREPESADVEALRRREAVTAAQGRTMFQTVALAGDGSVVAYSNLATTEHFPALAFQWGTLVRRADRGHRLGLAVKVANLRLLQRERPAVRRLQTWNAEVNEQMISVNDRLGFRPVERLGEFQKRLQ